MIARVVVLAVVLAAASLVAAEINCPSCHQHAIRACYNQPPSLAARKSMYDAADAQYACWGGASVCSTFARPPPMLHHWWNSHFLGCDPQTECDVYAYVACSNGNSRRKRAAANATVSADERAAAAKRFLGDVINFATHTLTGGDPVTEVLGVLTRCGSLEPCTHSDGAPCTLGTCSGLSFFGGSSPECAGDMVIEDDIAVEVFDPVTNTTSTELRPYAGCATSKSNLCAFTGSSSQACVGGGIDMRSNNVSKLRDAELI